jgi:hypothetical protein
MRSGRASHKLLFEVFVWEYVVIVSSKGELASRKERKANMVCINC